ncbi:hypothetical protein COLO4_36599 [Corchorus olitorius]|uniref:Uncharacterized protein n=1 Tax=Corchorus olitorius TaxID=93759 RepID=A0A1R3G7M4_9ROSI|nr:hypothetical protein COLO4_36599 [Corchorus olitorius]
MVEIVLKARINLQSVFDPPFCHRPKEEQSNSTEAPLG